MIAQAVVLLALGLDTLAVAISFGLAGLASHRVRIGFILALYSVLMPVIGLLAGESLSDSGAAMATYLAGLGLIGAGAYGLFELRSTALDETAVVEIVLAEDLIDERLPEAEAPANLVTRTIHVTAVLGSMDKLAVGLALGAQDVRPVGALVYLGFQSFALGLLGITLGTRLGARFGHRAEVASKLLLVAIGIALLLGQLLDLKLVTGD